MIAETCYLEVLVDAAKEVFETMIFMTVDDNPEVDCVEGDALLGSITFKGELEGCMSICCGKDDATLIAATMLGMEPEDGLAEEDIRDAMGEIANMVMGSVKARLLENGLSNLDVSIPCVVSGKELSSSLGDSAVQIKKVVCIDECPAELMLLYRSKES
ncbi:Chemotaxis protein CheC, inhibitor of MCP methylation [Anaerohalosphaera lusitana]|uniref:Chemotaxis protein CheC, inhibitor of MCP methylation n=1 Tax=Anaerohalosphaera lusitana TaxID=1936003 RepID=A0A1U9NGK3_9BACT|nr:chemotaxis protein CheX [Anaerohalosphaera lusitana]AQT66887.1 Chemotaxis protein CheC, inhibitor of MCP methylation [Anaerohalosphaera lusitana]